MPPCPRQRNQLRRLTSTLQFFLHGFLTVFVSSGASLEMIEQSQFLMVWTCFSTTVPRTCSILSWKEKKKKKKLNPNMTKLTSGVEWSWARKSQLHQRLKRCQVLNIKRHALFNLFACPENTYRVHYSELEGETSPHSLDTRVWWDCQTNTEKVQKRVTGSVTNTEQRSSMRT